jgi:cysteinyl-tRNA synthetase
MKIYNTLTRKKEEFKPIKDKKVGMYVCGPTVYDAPHIGHARSAYAFDVIRRYFEYKGYDVRFVRNVTDVDDKIINKANEEFKGEDLKNAVEKVSKKYLDVYHEYMKVLDIKEPDEEPRATYYVENQKMQDFIKILIERNMAYESNGDVYFDVKKAKSYGKLSNQSFDMLESGARVTSGENKKDPLDFALWKSAKEGEPSWDSPWGKGRPGWHIECSVMSSDILGDEFDIHGGGIDLIFPHHENEIAQSEGAGKKFANYWIHNGLLTINKEKMAKSLGNFITIEDFIMQKRELGFALEQHGELVLKLFFLATHYSNPLDYNKEAIHMAEENATTIGMFFYRIKKYEDKNNEYKIVEEFKEKLIKAMDDDFNTPVALSILLEMVSIGYKNIELSTDLALNISKTLEELLDIFGLKDIKKIYQSISSLPGEEEELIITRNLARKNKDFKEADRIRKELEEKGIILEDTKDGTTWRRK